MVLNPVSAMHYGNYWTPDPTLHLLDGQVFSFKPKTVRPLFKHTPETRKQSEKNIDQWRFIILFIEQERKAFVRKGVRAIREVE